MFKLKESRDGTMSQDIFFFDGGPADNLYLAQQNDPETWIPRPQVIVTDLPCGRPQTNARYRYDGLNVYKFIGMVK